MVRESIQILTKPGILRFPEVGRCARVKNLIWRIALDIAAMKDHVEIMHPFLELEKFPESRA